MRRRLQLKRSLNLKTYQGRRSSFQIHIRRLLRMYRPSWHRRRRISLKLPLMVFLIASQRYGHYQLVIQKIPGVRPCWRKCTIWFKIGPKKKLMNISQTYPILTNQSNLMRKSSERSFMITARNKQYGSLSSWRQSVLSGSFTIVTTLWTRWRYYRTIIEEKLDSVMLTLSKMNAWKSLLESKLFRITSS